MDYISQSFTTKMRLWKDDAAESTVRWFRALPTAKVFPGPHAFGSRSWLSSDYRGDDFGIGEIPGHWSRSRWDDPVGFTGQDYCGPLEAFREGGRPGDEAHAVLADGSCLCCRSADIVTDGGPEWSGGEAAYELLADGGPEWGGEATWGTAAWQTEGGPEWGGEATWGFTAMACWAAGPTLVTAAAGFVTIATVPAAKEVDLRNIDIQAIGTTGSTNVLVYLVRAVAGTTEVFWRIAELIGEEHVQWSGNLCLQAGDLIKVDVGTGGDVAVTLGGYIMTA